MSPIAGETIVKPWGGEEGQWKTKDFLSPLPPLFVCFLLAEVVANSLEHCFKKYIWLILFFQGWGGCVEGGQNCF